MHACCREARLPLDAIASPCFHHPPKAPADGASGGAVGDAMFRAQSRRSSIDRVFFAIVADAASARPRIDFLLMGGEERHGIAVQDLLMTMPCHR